MVSRHKKSITVNELALILKDWLAEFFVTELEQRNLGQQQEELGRMFSGDGIDVSKKVRARRFREVMAGLETLLIGESEIDYRMVLDHVLHNVGASLQSLGVLEPERGLSDPPVIDFRKHRTFPALVSPRRYVRMPAVTRALWQIGIGRGWAVQATAYLVEYREWQPRFLRSAAHDDERYTLFAWDLLPGKDLFFLPMGRLPGSEPVGRSELVVLGRSSSLLSRILDAGPRHREQIVRLTPRHFTLLLRALLLDYEALHTDRQREVAEQDQLGALLWDFLSREE